MINLETAIAIACAEIARRKKAARFNGLEIGETEFWRDQDEFWTFAAPIPQLQAEGVAPGAILVSVDKQDGHIWTERDFAKLTNEKVAA